MNRARDNSTTGRPRLFNFSTLNQVKIFLVLVGPSDSDLSLLNATVLSEPELEVPLLSFELPVRLRFPLGDAERLVKLLEAWLVVDDDVQLEARLETGVDFSTILDSTSVGHWYPILERAFSSVFLISLCGIGIGSIDPPALEGQEPHSILKLNNRYRACVELRTGTSAERARENARTTGAHSPSQLNVPNEAMEH
ncbi:hypothetical protein EVAR_69950_1 [Eumeta japonica]|uniref:Uncharacterized protein n=1 Tax=Eumeta variegata TaxID=151549 RepID=A0A4C1T8U5_EUMVA|nr:hypothetical protein EVAR_69950_1 [Eumeta japonica]